MKKIFIKICNIDDINTFVRKARDIQGDVLVSRGKFCVDGKSILGMYSLNVSQGCTVEYPEEEKDFEAFLQTFVGE